MTVSEDMKPSIADLFRIEVGSTISRNVLCEPEYFETSMDGFLDDFFEGTSGMFAELAGVRMMTMGHCGYRRRL